jgi:aspartate racemase
VGPLVRAQLLCLEDRDYILLLTFHQIVFDGWSERVLKQELQTLYAAFAQNRPSPLSPLAIQYTDFAAWQRQWLGGDRAAAQLHYWKQKLAGLSPLLTLPTDYRRPASKTFRGDQVQWSLNAEQTRRIQQLSQAYGCTLFMTLLAALQVLLLRYSDQTDIVVGTPAAGRIRPEIEPLIGSFANTLVLRSNLAGNPTFESVLRQVKSTAIEAYNHQDIPFDQVVNALHPEDNLSDSPLFQVMFGLQPKAAVEKDWQSLSLNTGYSKFDLEVNLQESPDGITGFWQYSTDLFARTTIERMVGHFETLLEAIVVSPDESIANLPMLSAAERHQLLVAWNQPQTDYPQGQCIHQLFEAEVEKTPDAIAVVFEDQHLTYRELNHRANQLAHYLQSLGVGPEVLVGICVERSIEMVVGLLGVLKAGGCYLPLDSAYPEDRLAYMVEDSQLSVLITQSVLREQFSVQSVQVVDIDRDWEQIAQQCQENPDSGIVSDNLAYIIYTSGSTGRPKGVMIEHQAITSHCYNVIKHYELNSTDRVLQFASSSFDASLEQILPTLIVGAVLFLRGSEVWSPFDFHTKITKYRLTVVDIPPAYLHQWLTSQIEDSKWSSINSLRLVICGGDILPSDSLYLWKQSQISSAQLLNAYGPTETTITTTVYDASRSLNDDRSVVSIGRPLGNRSVYILDKNRKLVPIGVPGELYIGGICLARGYLNCPELTDKKFIPHPFMDAEQGARLYATGDLARYLPDGNIEFLGRIDQQVKLRGFRIEPGEVEAALSQHPAVRQAAVIVREDEPGDKRLVAYWVAANAEVPTYRELRQFLQQTLPDYMIPSAFVRVESLPVTPNGKIDRRALPQPSLSDIHSSSDYVAPRTPLEQQMADIWAEVLKLEQVGIHDNFFELGGHSLLAVNLFTQIEKAFKKNLPLSTLFQAPTIAQLAQLLSLDGVAQSWSSLVKIQPNGSNPPFFCVHEADGHVLCYRELANHLGPEQPFYGLQPQHVDGKWSFHSWIEDMASCYIQELLIVQPEGPYFLGGLCAGGIIAFEMAQQLQAQGQEVALLALFDADTALLKAVRSQGSVQKSRLEQTQTPISRASNQELTPKKSDRSRLEKLVAVNQHLTQLSRLSYGEKLTYIFQKLKNRIVLQLEPSVESIETRKKLIVYNINKYFFPKASPKIPARQAFIFSCRHYIPKAYQGQITLFRVSEGPIARHSATGHPTGNSYVGGWDKLAAGGVQVYDIPGMHGTDKQGRINTFLQDPHVQVLADQLKVCIQVARSAQQTLKTPERSTVPETRRGDRL